MTRAYRVDRVLYLLHTDAEFLGAFRADAYATAGKTGCTPQEAAELARGDIGALYARGVHPFLLHGFVRHALCGIAQESYMKQVRMADRAARREGKAGAA